jgi:D-tyrosyl-tRNA(Tyr) deacylase
MRALIQRVSEASVTVEGEVVGGIGRGFLVLLGVTQSDRRREAAWLASKVAGLRVFDDAAGKMNLGLVDVGGAVLVVSQFTLYGDARKGRRPDFLQAARPEQAEPLVEYFVEQLRAAGLHVETGRFRAAMQVALVNDGPVTLWLDTAAAGLAQNGAALVQTS